MKAYTSTDRTRGILADDDLTEIIKSFGLTNVLVCDPEGLIETEELIESDTIDHPWDDGIDVTDLIKQFGISGRQLAYKFDIPYTTLSKWMLPEGNPNHRECPSYVISMMRRLLEIDRGK